MTLEELKKQGISNIVRDRLLTEWKQHGKIIIACDFDDTIKNWKLGTFALFRYVLTLLHACKQTGAYIVIFTACDKDRYSEIKDYCAANGLEIDSINENPIELPYGNQNKIYANIFLDDRAGIIESIEILEDTLYKYRGYLQEKKSLPDVA